MNAVVKQDAATGRFIGSSGLTDKQASFVKHYLLVGCNETKAAELSGYHNPETEGWRLVRLPHVAAAIRAETERLVHLKGAPKAVGFLIAAIEDKSLSGSTRHACAKTLLEVAGYTGPGRNPPTDPGDKPLSEYTMAELDAFISKQSGQLREIEAQQDAIPGDARQIEHDPSVTPEKP